MSCRPAPHASSLYSSPVVPGGKPGGGKNFLPNIRRIAYL